MGYKCIECKRVFAQDLGSFTQPENQEESNLELPDITPHHITDEAEITYEMPPEHVRPVFHHIKYHEFSSNSWTQTFLIYLNNNTGY